MAKPFEEGIGWAMRRRTKGHDIFVSGHPTSAAGKKAMELSENVPRTSSATRSVRSNLPYRASDACIKHWINALSRSIGSAAGASGKKCIRNAPIAASCCRMS